MENFELSKHYEGVICLPCFVFIPYFIDPVDNSYYLRLFMVMFNPMELE